MEIATPLPVREPLLPGESLTSLIRRTANAMGFEKPGQIRSLFEGTAGISAQWNQLLPGPIGQRLESLLRHSTSSLLSATVHQFANRLVLVASTAVPAVACDSKTILKYFQSANPPICPVCLIEDTHPYERLAWSLRALPVCLRHLCYLSNMCPKCRRKLRPDRNDVHACHCGFNFREIQPPAISESAIWRFRRIDQWFRGEALPLTGMRACAALWWLERLTAAVEKLPEWKRRVTDEMSIDSSAPAALAAWLAAANLLDEWPQQLFAFLDDFQRIAKHQKTVTGVTRSFGLLLREAKQLEDLGYPLPADALRQYLTTHYTAGHVTTKVCLFSTSKHAKLLEVRPWMSLTEADEKLRIRNGGSADLLERGILVGVVHPAASGRRTVGLVTRESVGEVERNLKTALSVNDAGKMLGLGRSRVLELVKTDLLPRAIWTKGGWRVPRTSISQLLDLVSQSPVCDKPIDQDWVSLRQATRQFGPSGLNLVRLLRLIQAGRARLLRSARTADFKSVLVCVSDLKKARPELHRMRDEAEGFPLCRLAKQLFPDRPLKEPVLKKWIAVGLLQASRHGRAWIISADEVKRFRSKYCLLHEASQLLKMHSKTLLRWIREDELTTVYGPRSATGGGFHLLCRSDVIRIQGAITRHRRKFRTHMSDE